MKKLLKYAFLMLGIVLLSGTVTSCGSDDDDPGLGNKISGKWKLKTYNGSSVSWGEYMEFSGSTLKWNSRLGGDNTTYSITYGTGNVTFNAKCTYTSSGDDKSDYDQSFTITQYTESTLTLIDNYSDVRVFSKY